MSDVLIILRTIAPQILSANSMQLTGSAHVAPYGNEIIWSTTIPWSSAANNTLMRSAVLASVRDGANAAGLSVNAGDTVIFFTTPNASIV